MTSFRGILLRLAAFAVACLAPFLAICQTMDPAARGKVMDAIRAKFDSLSALPPAKQREQMLAHMKALPSVERAMTSPDGNMCCVFKDGMPYMVVGNAVLEPEKPAEGFDWFFRGPQDEPAPAAQCSASQPEFSFQFQGNDLPTETKARIANTLGPSFGNGCAKVRELLTAKGYQVTPGEDASIFTLEHLGVNGVFLMSTHGGQGYVFDVAQAKWITDYVLVSGEEWNPTKEATFRTQGYIRQGLMGMCEAVYDVTGLLRKQIIKRYFTISKAFIKKNWKFSKNSFVAIHACTSYNLNDVMATPDVNASVFAGYNDLGNSDCMKGMKFLFDRLMGVNDDEVQPHESGFPQRPFDYNDLDTDMKRKGLYPVQFRHEGNAHSTSLLFRPCRDDFGLLAPSIKNVAPVAWQTKAELFGMFGVDPGNGNRSVKLGGVAMVVDKWEPDKITIFLPNSENDCHGEIQVISRGRPSNSRWFSNWKGSIKVKISGQMNLVQNAEFLLNLIGDPWPYREHAGEKPVDPPVWPVSSCIGSTCTWGMQGQETDGDGHIINKWVGSGNPKVQVDGNILKKDTFGVGVLGDSFQKKVNFTFGISDYFSYNHSGYVNPNTPVKLGDWTQGQSLIQAKYDTDFGILGDQKAIEDDPSRLDYSANNAKVVWTSMQCRFPMPKTAPR